MSGQEQALRLTDPQIGSESAGEPAAGAETETEAPQAVDTGSDAPPAAKAQSLRIKPSKPVAPAAETHPKRPCVALMGEFSAGKSTLSNLLIGASALPVHVTATQLPPVWISHGDTTPYRVDLHGDDHEVDVHDLEQVSVEDTNHIRIFRNSKILELCDLIDMPGISDPNMAATVWQRVIHNADIVIWCSHATQAWRQSEAAVWATMPPDLREKSILLLTRMDKILSDRDQMRVIKRVQSETKGLFREVLPVSLIKALEANHNSDAWAESGADHLMTTLVGLIDEVASGEMTPKKRVASRVLAEDVDSSIGEEVKPKPARIVMPTRVRPRPLQS